MPYRKKPFLFLLIIISFFACSKKSNVDNDIPKDIPAWLQEAIVQLKNVPDKELYTVKELRINGATVYMLRSPVQSCMYCDLYDNNGVKLLNQITPDTQIEEVRNIWPSNRQ